MNHLTEIQRICLGFPDAIEKETWGIATFRVNDKMFVTCAAEGAEEPTMTMKAPPGEQQILLDAADQFFYPSYVGSKGWIGVRLSKDTDWEEIAELVEDSYRMIAPKGLLKELDAG
jgi:predicted DNA-binding protein (MmcQ/YjbR family)